MSTAPRPTALVDYLRLATDYLQNCGIDSARLDAELLLAHVLDLDRVALYVNYDRPLVQKEVDEFRDMLRRRCRGTPIAYITGERPFLSTSLHVSPAVLIPRPETELLVEAVVEWLRQRPGETLFVADVGTGSGAIAVGIALAEPRARVVVRTSPPMPSRFVQTKRPAASIERPGPTVGRRFVESAVGAVAKAVAHGKARRHRVQSAVHPDGRIGHAVPGRA